MVLYSCDYLNCPKKQTFYENNNSLPKKLKNKNK